MKKETMEYAEQQPKVTVCNGGKQVLVLTNERVEERTNAPMGDDEEPVTTKAYVYDGYWLDVDGRTPLAAAKEAVTKDIEAYDASLDVNAFVLNGASVWLDKATRVGLMNSTTIARSMGNKTTTLWLGDIRLEVDCDKAIQLLSALEMYALDCFNTTAAHKAAVAALDTVEDVLAYDYTSNYPEKLEMTV